MSSDLALDAVDLFVHPFGPSPSAREAFARAAQEPLDRYPEPPVALRKVIAARHRLPLGGVVIGAGIAELLARVFAAVVRPGDSIVANTPTWPLIPHLCRVHGAEPRKVPYRVRDGRAEHDLDAVLAAIDHETRLVYLSSPGNPTGGALDRDAVRAFLHAVPRHVVTVIDEAYVEYATRPDAFDGAQAVRVSDQALVVLRTFSKVYGLAGLRVGYALATPDLARTLEAGGPPFVLVRGAEAAALAAFADAAHVKRTVAHVAARRAAMEAVYDARRIARLASDAPFLLAADPAAAGPRYFDNHYSLLVCSEPEERRDG